ncbi:unnamed protein product [Brassica rapa]|uniref:Uncharacterized protein n=2 Tax=Brassica TaxID=3705 RepID=A0A8D9M562_BRACM|nr:unnamed protein product [Brassica napus]CAG7898778.1 unnamed protein product [Brassica rapa]
MATNTFIIGSQNITPSVAKYKMFRKNRKVKIVLRRDELKKLILFHLNAGKGKTTLASLGDFLKELEAERSAGGAAAKAVEEEDESCRRSRKWRPSFDRIIEWPEETLA